MNQKLVAKTGLIRRAANGVIAITPFAARLIRPVLATNF